MTSANVELGRSIFAEWERGDFSSSEWAHPEIEYAISTGPFTGSWRGLAGMIEGWRGFLDAWVDCRGVAEEHRELDDERILVLIRASGRGRRSGLDLSQVHGKGAALFHITAGKVTKLVVYLDRERAFADLGLQP